MVLLSCARELMTLYRTNNTELHSSLLHYLYSLIKLIAWVAALNSQHLSPVLLFCLAWRKDPVS